MSKGYLTVIELEHLEDFLNGTGDFNGLTVAILMYTAHQLNKLEEFLEKFKFEVICYG
jgi:hypothetical protein